MPILKRLRSNLGPKKQSGLARTTTPRSHDSSEVFDFAEELDAITVHVLDEAPEFHVRPAAAGTSYVEAMAKEHAEAQLNHYRAIGEKEARQCKEEANEHREKAERETFLIDEHKPVVVKAWSKYHALLDVVGDAYVRRHPRERYWYHARMLFLLLGDLVGVAGGAIILGEIPGLAVLQAMAAAAAAVTSGLLAAEIKDSRLARQRERDPKTIPNEHKRHAHLFAGADEGEFLVRLMVFGSLTIILLLGIGIFMLRSSTEGAGAGFVFGMIAIAVAMGSWVNTYHYTDELADKVEQAENLALRTNRHHKRLMTLPARGIVARAESTATSIEKEYEELGLAAYHRVMALVNAWLAGRASIFGHGYPAEPKTIPAAGGAGTITDGPTKPADLRAIIAAPSTNGHQPLLEKETS